MKKILITGSTDGIGKLAAFRLAKDGHTIIVHGRNRDKVMATAEEVKAETANPNMYTVVSDLSEFNSIQEGIKSILAAQTSIDILINNAGVYKSRQMNNSSGYDLRFMVNYFAPYLLTYGLLPILRKGTDLKVINLSSAAQSTVSLPALSGKMEISEGEAYAQSKLALTM